MGIPIEGHETTLDLSQLLARVQLGEEVIPMLSGHPIVPLPRAVERRLHGNERGNIRFGTDFDDPLPNEILDSFG